MQTSVTLGEVHCEALTQWGSDLLFTPQSISKNDWAHQRPQCPFTAVVRSQSRWMGNTQMAKTFAKLGTFWRPSCWWLAGKPSRGPWSRDTGALSGPPWFPFSVTWDAQQQGVRKPLKTRLRRQRRAASGCGWGGSKWVGGRVTPRASAGGGSEWSPPSLHHREMHWG